MIRTNWKSKYLSLNAEFEARIATERRSATQQLSEELNAMKSAYARLTAENEALRASIDAVRFERDSVQRRLDEVEAAMQSVQAEATRLRRDEKIVETRAELLSVARNLSQQGVPCFARGTTIYHAHTRAILAYVRN